MSAITLTHPTGGAGGIPLPLELPDQLSWSDEFGWSEVEQSAEYAEEGSLIVDAFKKLAGRTITLEGDMTRAWCQRGALLVLRQWAGQPGVRFSLLLRGTTYKVIFDHEAGAVDAQPVIDWVDPLPDDPYAVTLRFLEMPDLDPEPQIP